ncbi:hypothetical protein [Pseudomonas sp. PAMC 25886]|jgi:hypothetical protein|uniref:hypothetical protein n=1 Tax=Pseudomonas sp. PAMC 25886 TaxID=1125977 RepID=UPI0011464A5D|nr:hypothetical protein [Pseudomonas sp. PAMC 25886]
MMALRYASRSSDYPIPSATESDILHGVQRVVVFKLSALMGQERYVPYSTGEAAAVPETDLNCSLMEYAADE